MDVLSLSQNNTKLENVLKDLKDQVLNLLDDLLEILPDESDILLVRLFFENHMDSLYIMQGFDKWVYPWKEYITERNERFFAESDHIFGPIPPEKIVKFKKIYHDGKTLDTEDKKVIWDYFQIFIKLIERYKKLV